VNGYMTLKSNLKKLGWRGMDWIDLGPVKGFCEHGNELVSSIKCWKISE
jgi:hypothetical protein